MSGREHSLTCSRRLFQKDYTCKIQLSMPRRYITCFEFKQPVIILLEEGHWRTLLGHLSSRELVVDSR